MFEKIKRGKVDFPEREWKFISCSAKDFILRLLDTSPKKRYRAEKIRSHPWITSDHKEDLQYEDRSENIERYDINRKMEKVKFMIEMTMSEISGMQERG